MNQYETELSITGNNTTLKTWAGEIQSTNNATGS